MIRMYKEKSMDPTFINEDLVQSVTVKDVVVIGDAWSDASWRVEVVMSDGKSFIGTMPSSQLSKVADIKHLEYEYAAWAEKTA